MKRIKSAQYIRISNLKPFSDDLDSQYDMSKCRLCKDPKEDDDLTDGYCQECLESGVIKTCSNCGKYVHEDEAIDTVDGPMCPDCGEDLYDDRGKYIGPRRTYYSGPAEWY